MRAGACWCVLGIFGAQSTPLLGEGALRNLAAFSGGDSTFTAVITITQPPNVFSAGLEDTPPPGWIVSNISDSGSFDTQTQSIKWGPFFSPAIPTQVSYDVIPPATLTAVQCFSGTVSFDGLDQAIMGVSCVPSIPAVSIWGMVVMGLTLIVAGSIRLRRTTLLYPRSAPDGVQAKLPQA